MHELARRPWLQGGATASAPTAETLTGWEVHDAKDQGHDGATRRRRDELRIATGRGERRGPGARDVQRLRPGYGPGRHHVRVPRGLLTGGIRVLRRVLRRPGELRPRPDPHQLRRDDQRE